MKQQIELTAKISVCHSGKRIDHALSKLFPEYSRSYIKKWIINHIVKINNRVINKPKKKFLREIK